METVDVDICGPLVVISPHCDDAVFACGRLLDAHPGSTVVTIFAGRPPGGQPITEWDRASGFQPGDDVIAVRREEDAAALSRLRARPMWLNFCDSQYGRTPTVEAVADALSEALKNVIAEAVMIPLGLFHSDRVLAHEAGIRLLERHRERRGYLYEDALYRQIPGLVDGRLSACAARGLHLEPVSPQMLGTRARKEEAIRCYRSQLRALATPGRLGCRDALLPERYWRLTSLPAYRITALPVTVVIPTFNRVEEVTGTVGRLSALPERPRIIVVDNGSSDHTAEIVTSRFTDVTVIRLDRNHGAAARNVGIEAATTPYVALCDDDTWWAPGALTRAMTLLERYPRLAVISARVVILTSRAEDPTCRRMAESPLPRDPELPGSPILGFLAGASMIRRSAVLNVGGFEPRFLIGGEEALLALDLAAAGWAMAYVDDVVVYHCPSARRDAKARLRLLCRNALWLAWLRRPAHVALLQTVRTLGRAFVDRYAAAGVAQALTGLPWVFARRQVLPPQLEACVLQLERFDKKA